MECSSADVEGANLENEEEFVRERRGDTRQRSYMGQKEGNKDTGRGIVLSKTWPDC